MCMCSISGFPQILTLMYAPFFLERLFQSLILSFSLNDLVRWQWGSLFSSCRFPPPFPVAASLVQGGAGAATSPNLTGLPPPAMMGGRLGGGGGGGGGEGGTTIK